MIPGDGYERQDISRYLAILIEISIVVQVAQAPGK